MTSSFTFNRLDKLVKIGEIRGRTETLAVSCEGQLDTMLFISQQLVTVADKFEKVLHKNNIKDIILAGVVLKPSIRALRADLELIADINFKTRSRYTTSKKL